MKKDVIVHINEIKHFLKAMLPIYLSPAKIIKIYMYLQRSIEGGGKSIKVL